MPINHLATAPNTVYMSFFLHTRACILVYMRAHLRMCVCVCVCVVQLCAFVFMLQMISQKAMVWSLKYLEHRSAMMKAIVKLSETVFWLSNLQNSSFEIFNWNWFTLHSMPPFCIYDILCAQSLTPNPTAEILGKPGWASQVHKVSVALSWK